MKKFIHTSNWSLIPFAFAAVVVIYSCSKERIESKNTYSPVNTYLDSKKQKEQEFIIDSTGSGPIVGNQGTKIWTGKQCLMFPNGDSVTWPFTVKLVELYTPKDMIYYQQPTVASVGILKTDGEIRLRAFKNTTELKLKPDPCMAAIEMPNAAPQTGMRVFYGYGFGYFGKLGVALGIVIAVIIYLLQLLLANWYLQRYSVGPVEWLLRKFVYLRNEQLKS